MEGLHEDVRDVAKRAVECLDAKPVKGGQYTVILDPGLAGVFVHEAFGRLNADTGNGTVRDLLINATATIGENIVLRRVSVLEKTDEQIFGSYNHMNGKIVVVDVLEGGDELVAKDVCMHVAAMNPLYLNRDVYKRQI